MAVNKKIKSFSPYNYNVQYAKPGAGINQKGKQYIKSSPVNQEEYVVTRKLPSFFAHLSNVFHYTISDECEIKFLKAVSTFSIKKDGIFQTIKYKLKPTESKEDIRDFYLYSKNSHILLKRYCNLKIYMVYCIREKAAYTIRALTFP